MAEGLLDLLADRGIPYLFGLPGSTEGAVLDEFSQREGGASPEWVLCLHEGVAVAMADGYGRVSGRPGVCLVHTTVGGGNAVSQLFNASSDNVPVLCIVGHKDTSLYNTGGFCTTEYLPGWFGGAVKHATQVFRPSDVVDDVDRQLLRAAANPPGPTVVVVPQDFLETTGTVTRFVDGMALDATPSAGRPDARQLHQLHDRLRAAELPVLLAGDWVYREGAAGLVEEFARAYGMQIVGEPRRSASRRGRLSASPLYVGEFEDCMPLVAAADLVLALGAKTFVEFERAARQPAIAKRALISVHPSPTEALARTPASLSLVASVRATLEDGLALVAESKGAGPARPAVERKPVPRAATSGPLDAPGIGRVLDEYLPETAVLLDEAVTSSPPLMRQLSICEGREYHRNTGGALGWGIPAAIGAQLAAPERPVVCLVGDGSAMFGLQGLWTAARRQSPVLFLVVNNGGYGSVVGAVGRYRGAAGRPTPGLAFDEVDIDFPGLSRSLGVDALRVESLEDLAGVVEKWAADRRPLLVDCPIAPPAGMR